MATQKTTPKRYTVREIPWLAGSRRRIVDRFQYFYEACRLAETLSLEHRQMVVECKHVQLAVWLDGKRLVN